jgi:starvation-inducible DNA-binding protein
MDSALIAKHLSGVLADTYTLLLKTQNYHWNVTGPHFHSLHGMFEDQYTELFAAVDVIAERIRMLGHTALGSFAEFGKLASIPEAKSGLDGLAMAADLLAAHKTVLERVHACAHVADDEDDEGTEDLMTQRIASHQKAIWMLQATVGSPGTEKKKAPEPPVLALETASKKTKNGRPAAKPEKKKAPKAIG